MKSELDLPIEQLRPDLPQALGQTGRVIIQAPTGSGKSTRIPAMLVDAGLANPRKRVVVLQPRRLAARMLAARVAMERGVVPGGEVGYHIRFDRVAGADTSILYITEGILLRMLQQDPHLEGVGTVIFDEFHERHLHADLGIALVKHLQESHRADLRLLVMSATLDTRLLADYLENAVVLQASGRTYPVEIGYAGGGPLAKRPVWEQAASHFARMAAEGEPGDGLIFMPGSYEIRKTVEALQSDKALRDWIVLPLSGDLPPDAQDAAVARYDRPKVVVATNVAETSLTIDGIRTVVDSGLARTARYDPHRGINTLLIGKISRASAEQRAGRAGRTAPGRCLRLWSEREHEHLSAYEEPEIQRVDLSATLLSLKALGYADLENFAWLEAPQTANYQRAVSLLQDLGAFDALGDLTSVGQRMAEFPAHPRFARMFLAAAELGCVRTIALVAALCEGRPLLPHVSDRKASRALDELLGEAKSDITRLLRAFGIARGKNFNLGFCRNYGIHAGAAREAERGFRQYLEMAQREGLDIGGGAAEEETVSRCLLYGFADHIAIRDNRATLRCQLVHGRRGELRRGSAAEDSQLLVATQIDEIESRGEVTVYLSLAAGIEEAWLKQGFAGDFEESRDTYWDAALKRVCGRERRSFRGLVLEEREYETMDLERAACLLVDALESGEAGFNVWTDGREQWIARVNLAARLCPELEIAPLNDEDRRIILEQFCHGATAVKTLRKRPFDPWLHDWLTPEQRLAMEQMVPESFKLPGRSKPIVLRYTGANDRVVLSSRLQDFYDVDPASLRICGGRLPLTLELLAPNGRPAQITDDLAGFWANSYPMVKKELKGRYPKHEWR